MKKVAIFTLSLRGGGAERIVTYLLKEGFRDFEFHLILLRKEIDYNLPRIDNLKIFELDNREHSKFIGVLKIPALAKKLKKYLLDNNIETLLTLLTRANLIACFAKRNGWKGKLIISERADTIAYYKTVRFGSFMIWLVKNYYRNADVVTAISKGIASSLKTLGIHNCKVIYNPIDTSVAEPNNYKTHIPFTFINVARMDPQKNQELLLRGFAELRDQNCKLIILGKGNLNNRLKRITLKLKIKNRVIFAGFQSDVRSWLEKSDCLVLSSDYEGLGNVILEALNFGVPVISTDCPYGPREILAPKTDTDSLIKDYIEMGHYGILTPIKNINSMAEAMEEMMSNSALRNKYSKLGLERVLDFDIKKIAKQYFDLF